MKTQSHMEQGGEKDRKERAEKDREEGMRKIFSMGKMPMFHEIPDSCIRYNKVEPVSLKIPLAEKKKDF